jgi:hypothetical protein
LHVKERIRKKKLSFGCNTSAPFGKKTRPG